MTISILGCGWYGTAFAKELIQQGHTIKGSITSAEKKAGLSELDIIPYVLKIEDNGEAFISGFFKCDVLIISIPPGLRKGNTAGYLPKISSIKNAILQYKITRVIYISSTGVYSDHNTEVNELSDPAPVTEASLILLEAENLLQQEKAFKTTVLRFGGLVGPGRDPGRFFAGKKDIPNGRAPVNLIHLEDCVGVSIAVLQHDAFGFIFNACSPDHPQKAAFYLQAAMQAGLEAPQFVDELTDWKIVNSVNIPAILDYKFKKDSWASCLF